MPSTYAELLSRLDMTLGEPLPYSPSEPQRYEALRQQAQLLFNQALNAPPAWSVASTTLTVNDGTDTYSLAVADFSEDILVETVDASDAQHISRAVQRSSLGSQPLSREMSFYNDHLAESYAHSAQTFAFYREGGTIKVRVSPMPSQSATYRIWYKTLAPNTDALGNSFQFPHGETYLLQRTAAQLLPLCRWAGFAPEENAARRRELGAAYGMSIPALELEYKRFLASDRQTGRVVLRGLLDNY